MLQTIYEADSSISADWRRRILDTRDTMNESGSEVLSAVGRSEVSMSDWDCDSDEWEKQLQRELLLIQRQQQIQKQLLISEFQKQHQNLLRQHQAQLEEHIKLQQALLTLRQQQEVFTEERRLVEEEREEVHEEEKEIHRRETQKQMQHRRKERSKESAMASTEVRQKLHDFLMSKSAKDPSTFSAGYPLSQRAKLWYSSAHPGPAEQSSPPLGETPPTFKYPLTSGLDYREDFPLRKTASEPNLKVRYRLKQKVFGRRSGPMRRRDGSILVTPLKKRTLELTDSSANESPAGSGPSSPMGLCNNENGAPYRCSTTEIERCLSQSGVLKTDGSISLLNLYTSPSLPNLTQELHPAHAHICTGTALKDRTAEGLVAATSPVSLESKVSNGQQALLQHLLLKEQRLQRQMISPGSVPVQSPSPLVMKDRPAVSSRARLPRHRPLNRTQSAPLPQSTLAQLVLQQQHQNFVEKQKQYHQQVHISQVLSQSIEQLRNPGTHLEEEEEEEEGSSADHREWEITSPPAVVIRSRSFPNSTCITACNEPSASHAKVVRLKQEPQEEERESERGRDTGEKDKRNSAQFKRRDAEQCLENMTETDV
ncbi:histone deacetylase 9-B isoform X2 [Myxocyprinus asiaticus]|uniref:histone deacetylase 9-B isoform X2 n=1 Tax=Myxocyprinus asiaticus TaxID=70543 RepID=UPI00222182C6|nr:histone deacetylase 9-B isoform X2 [Myxocyprinus asiaticus]